MNSKNNILLQQTQAARGFLFDNFSTSCFIKQENTKQLSFSPRQCKDQSSSHQTFQNKQRQEDEEFNKLYTNLSYFLFGLMLLILLLAFLLKPFLVKNI